MKQLSFAFILLAAGIVFGSVLSGAVPKPAGDICEYYGVTETLRSHRSLDLQATDVTSLEHAFGGSYYDLWYCYGTGKNGLRYPLHFPGYSIVALPVRLILEYARIDPLRTLSVTNALFFTLLLIGTTLYLHQNKTKSIIFTVATISSPLLFFLTWPGPDSIVMMMLLTSLILFLHGNTIFALYIIAFASWQSQPLLVSVLVLGLYLLWTTRTKHFTHVIITACISLIPYMYNLYIFGVLTPWQTLPDGWTQNVGFGIHNIQLLKFLEQIFDLNIGVFWYAPILVGFGILVWLKAIHKHTQSRWLLVMAILTALAFQTNPAWHYGTSGFGPSRHAIFLVPFFIAILTYHATNARWWKILISTILVSQIYVLSINNYIFPIFTNTLVHTPIARFVLDNWPALYSPTPELFVDRTNHTDEDHITTAIYTSENGVCRKAYVLINDIDRVIEQCGPFPNPPKPSIINPKTDGFYVTYE